MNAGGAVGKLALIFEQNARKQLLILPDGSGVTYREFWRKSKDMARRIVELGVGAGDRLLIQLENSEPLLELYFACAITGAVACPVDTCLPTQRVASLKAKLQPALHVTDDLLAELTATPGASVPDFSAVDDDADFLIIFSSGTTGDPKGIVHSLQSIVASAASFSSLSGMNGDSVVYHHFPMYYMAGIFNLLFCPVLAGGTIVLGPKFSRMQMLRFWELPLKHGVNYLTITPTMAQSLCQLYRRDERLLSHLAGYQAIISTSSPLYPSIAARFLDTFNVPLRTCYGVTEVGGTITFQSWEDALACQSMGSTAPNTQVRAGSGNIPREILVRTPFMAKGYLVNGRIVDPCDADGFFHTGDLGELEGGLLYFCGREHDLVKKGGEFVSTELIEDLALRNRHVVEASAVGVPDEFWGARVVLFYVPMAEADEEGVTAEFNRLFAEGLREIERPDKMIPVPWMPKTSIGKTLKRELVEKYSVSFPA